MSADSESTPPIALAPAQARIVAHPRGPMLVLGGGGSGRSEALALRVARLAAEGSKPERILVVTVGEAGATRLRARVADLLGGPYEELQVHTFESVAERLLREFAVEAGLDPFFAAVTPADRLALLLEVVDDLPLRRHEIRGNPAGLLARLLERIDVLKDEGVGPAAIRDWAESSRRAASEPKERETALREREFAELYSRHDQLLHAHAGLDRGDLVLTLAELLRERPDVAGEIHSRIHCVMADELEDCGAARLGMLFALAPEGNLIAAWDGRQGVRRFRVGADAALADFRRSFPGAEEVRLEQRHRGGPQLAEAVRAASALTPSALRGERLEAPAPQAAADSVDPVRFWRCVNDRAQAQAVARDIERLLSSGEATHQEICVLARPGGGEGRRLAAALEERSIPFHTPGAAALFRRAEVRDVLAWLRILANPRDSAAAVRALTRPPVQLRSSDLARCTAIARRRKLDMVSAVEAAIESPQLGPESRDRIRTFLKLYRAAENRMEDLHPEVFVRRLIERVGIRRQNLFAASPETAERLASLAQLSDIAAEWSRRKAGGSCREFIDYLAAVAEAGERFDTRSVSAARGSVLVAAPSQVKGLEFDFVYVIGLHRQAFRAPPGRDHWIPDQLVGEGLPEPGDPLVEARRSRLAYTALSRAKRGLVLAWPLEGRDGPEQPSPVYSAVLAAVGGEEVEMEEELFGPAESMHATYRMLRDEVLESSWRAGGALSEMRLDTAEDVNSAVVRFLELLKLAALIQRPGSESADDSIAALNDVLGRSATPEQRMAFEASALDSYVLTEERERRLRREAVRSRAEPGLEPFLPRKDGGLALSASDIDLYRTCPLKYKFARVFAIPQEPTINMRFGILLHNVLERYHADELRAGGDNPAETGLDKLLALFEAGWRRSGFGASDDELQYRDRAVAALARYHERDSSSAAEPVWLERSFNFKIAEHRLRGRVDRVDKLPDGGYELIDYKTGQPRSAPELADDIQLALYRMAAREAWELDETTGAYWYVLDDAKVPVAGSPDDLERVERTVIEVGEGIGGQDFEPRPDFQTCSWCDYRLICPASEA